jgi:hypothetical protein
MIVAERAVGGPLVCMGRFAEARQHLDRIPGLPAPGDQRPLRFLYGQDPPAAGLATGAWALWGVRRGGGCRRAGRAGDRGGRGVPAAALARLEPVRAGVGQLDEGDAERAAATLRAALSAARA